MDVDRVRRPVRDEAPAAVVVGDGTDHPEQHLLLELHRLGTSHEVTNAEVNGERVLDSRIDVDEDHPAMKDRRRDRGIHVSTMAGQQVEGRCNDA